MKNKLFRRAASIALSLAMVGSTMTFSTACSSGSSKKDLIQLDVVSTRANYAGIQGGWMGEVLAEKFGVQLNVIKGDEVTLAINLQSGDMGDLIVIGAGSDTYKKAAEKGLLLNWESGDILEKYGSYIQENCQTDLENMRQYADDGNIYGIAGSVSTTADGIDTFFYNWDIRWDLYEELGCPEVKDLNDLYDLFVSMKEIYPTNDLGQETYAFSMWPDWDGEMVMYAKCLAQAYYGLEGDYVPGLYDNEDGAYYDVCDEDGYFLEMIRFLNKCYRAGLVDPNSSTQTYDEAISKLKNDRVFFSLFNYAGSTAYNTSEHLSAGKAMYSLVPEEAETIVYGLSDTGLAGMTFAIGANTEYPDLCMEILNWMFTPEGRLTTEYGPEGLCWYIEDGKTYFTDLGAALHDNTSLKIGDLYKYTDADGIEHIISQYDVANGKYSVVEETGDDGSAVATGDSYEVTLYYELPSEYEAYRGMAFADGTNEMNNITWNLNTINPLTGERFNCDYWESTAARKVSYEIEEKWLAWANAQTDTNVFDSDSYLGSTNYRVYLTIHDTADIEPTDLKTTHKQITGSKTGIVCTSCWSAILADTEEECEQIIADMITKVNAFGADGTTKSYQDIVDWAADQCATRYQIEQEYLSSK